MWYISETRGISIQADRCGSIQSQFKDRHLGACLKHSVTSSAVSGLVVGGELKLLQLFYEMVVYMLHNSLFLN